MATGCFKVVDRERTMVTLADKFRHNLDQMYNPNFSFVEKYSFAA